MIVLLCLLLVDVPRFEATTVDAPAVGEWTELRADWAATVGGTRIGPGRLVEVHQAGVARPAAPTGTPHVRLLAGDVWPARLNSLDNDVLNTTIDLGFAQDMRVPASDVAEVWLGPARPVSAVRPTDELHLKNGDTLRGTVVGMGRGEFTLEAAGKRSAVGVDRVAGVAFSTALARPGRARDKVGRVVLANGARVVAKRAELADGRLALTTAGGLAVRVRLGDVVCLYAPEVAYLSEMKESKYEHVPFLALAWPLGRDANAAGGPLRLGGETFDRGLGLHSRARAEFPVPAGAGRFEAWVGLDAVIGVRGNVRLGVEVDGKPAVEPWNMSGGDPARRLAVPLPRGAKSLVLSVDFGAGGDVQDHVNWADARFVRAP
ncbi:MAG: NPCBM/NEW2 domain-containing protein [Gemmataceae bacterium]|nr:NPCBM/NEW2 domain-containing protein [Gemmataceae bacterium]